MDVLWALIGGGIIGLSVTLMLLWNGRVTGISGIVNGSMSYVKGDWGWRVMFILGLIAGGAVTGQFIENGFQNLSGKSVGMVSLAGLLVGFGTILGSGCTSGHGICGISRMSPRSLIATGTFMVTGIVMVYVVKQLVGGSI
jgi:uncharacterized protein